MRTNSLWFRLIASSSVIAIVLLLSAAFLLNAIFVSALQRNFDQRLRAALDGILANVELGADGKPQLQNQLADTRFALPLSGWYWQITSQGESKKLLSSNSLLEQQLSPPAEVLATRGNDGVASFSMLDPQGTNLRVIEQDLKLFNDGKTYAFIVSGNFDELKNELTNFQRTLYGVLAVLGLALLAGLVFQIRYTLKPLQDMQHQLNNIRSGRAERLSKTFPLELQPVADELNLVMQSNLEIVERARMQVGNLAHALKTPISVLTNETSANKSPLASKVSEQVGLMREQVELYLDRARRAVRAQNIGAATEVEPVLQALARTLQRINSERRIAITVEVQPGLRFRGEKPDLEEMVGNLMDNACKWAKSRVTVRGNAVLATANEGRTWLEIVVDDDGPGIPKENRKTALQRGKRLDESKPGSGLGMSIISETAAIYGGKLTLDDTALGGLRGILRLPIVS